MKRIAVIIYSNIVGGHEFQTIELIKDLSKDNIVDVFVDSALDLKRSFVNQLPNKITSLDIYINGKFYKQLCHAKNLRQILKPRLKDYNIIIVSGGSIEATIAVGYALKSMNVFAYTPYFIDRRKLWHNKIGYLYNWLNYVFCKPFKKLITINRIQSKLFSPYIKNTIIVPNRIDNTSSIYVEDKSKESVLYFVGRLEKTKGVIELIDYLDDKENPFSKFIIVGDGTLYEEIKKRASQTKYINIKLLGWLPKEKQDTFFGENDIYITMSMMEGEPLAIREANQRNSIVIASNIDGHRGCVSPKNRFSNKRELIEKLIFAKQGKLLRTNNYSIDEIETAREKAIKEICLQ